MTMRYTDRRSLYFTVSVCVYCEVYLLLERVVSRSDDMVFCRLQPINTCPRTSSSRVPVMTPLNAGHIAVERPSRCRPGTRRVPAASHVDVDRATPRRL